MNNDFKIFNDVNVDEKNNYLKDSVATKACIQC